jgi:hypothetical protein
VIPHPAIVLGISTPFVLLGYRLMPNLELALCWYAWAFVAITWAMQVIRPEVPDETLSVMVLVALASTAAAAAGDPKLARLFFGLNIVGLLTVVVLLAGRDPLWWAYANAGATEFVSWLLGNASRGTFGPDVAASAIGQAYGPWAMPTQLLIIAAGYTIASRYATYK